MSNEAVCRTAPATPGLLMTPKEDYTNIILKLIKDAAQEPTSCQNATIFRK